MSETQTATSTPWYAEAVPAEAHEYVANKQWKGPGDAVSAYQSLERFLGADKAGRGVVLPKDENDAEGWNSLYSKLGRPEKPDGYGLPDGFGKTASEWFHEAGLTPKQAKALAEKWDGFSAAEQERIQTELASQWEQESTALKSEWGDKYDAQIDSAKRAAQRLGVDEATLEKLQSGMGQAGLMKFFSQVGSLFAEDKAPDGTKPAMGRTPEVAQAEIRALMQDAEFAKRRMSGDVVAVKQWNELHAQAFPGNYSGG
jgi:hypothetical protein